MHGHLYYRVSLTFLSEIVFMIDKSDDNDGYDANPPKNSIWLAIALCTLDHSEYWSKLASQW